MKFPISATLILMFALASGCSQEPEAGVSSSPEDKEYVVILSESNFQGSVLDSSKPVLVDFWAAWCGPCNHMTPVVEEIAQEHEDRFVVGKVNTDEENALALKYNISSIPAFLFFKDGKVAKSVVGVQSKDSLVKILESLEDNDG